jgi:hypothetical protein
MLSHIHFHVCTPACDLPCFRANEYLLPKPQGLFVVQACLISVHVSITLCQKGSILCTFALAYITARIFILAKQLNIAVRLPSPLACGSLPEANTCSGLSVSAGAGSQTHRSPASLLWKLPCGRIAKHTIQLLPVVDALSSVRSAW